MEKLEQDIEMKDREIYNLKHDLISNQIKTESDEKTLTELQDENKELLLSLIHIFLWQESGTSDDVCTAFAGD